MTVWSVFSFFLTISNYELEKITIMNIIKKIILALKNRKLNKSNQSDFLYQDNDDLGFC